MPISLNGSSGITTPGITNTGSQAVVDLTTSGNTIIGDASTDTLNVGNGGLVKNASGNVGIGLSNPSAKLEVNPAADSYFTGGLRVNRSNDGQQYGTVTCDGNLVLTSVETAIGAPVIAFRTSTNGTTSTERARIDSSGNLGLGVTPSAWGGNTRAYDLQYYNTFSGGDDSSRAYMLLGSNFYEAAAGTQRYKVTNANIPATMY